MDIASAIPHLIALTSHSSARNQCVARTHFKAGSCILSTPAFASILYQSEKGNRCDTCFRHPSRDVPLKRCSGCASYWYCDTQCQALQWQAHHKKICKVYNSHITSMSYQDSPHHERLDSILLSHLFAQLSLLSKPYSLEESLAASILVSLLPHPAGFTPPPPICSIKPSPPYDLMGKLYARFGNNNFAIHSHLDTVGHGVFPIASRLFNHSCLPNAAAKYVLSQGLPVEMQLVALCDIYPGEEICLPYLDPALLDTRKQILNISYGFECECPSCSFLNHIGLPKLPQSASELSLLEKQLREFVGLNLNVGSSLPNKSIETLPPALHCFLREAYIQDLSEKFSKASHEGPYEVALDSGITLLSLYIIVYPINYPQIGMHTLELAKTIWNASITSADFSAGEEKVRVLLAMARQVMDVFGGEGDDDGPLKDIQILEGVLMDG